MLAHLGFEHPWVLLFLLGVLGLFVWLLIAQRQFWRDAFAFSQVSVLTALKSRKNHVLHQRLAPMLMLLALTASIMGLSQPYWKTSVASHNGYLVLALDISISMEASDMAPNRLEVARSAATEFIRDLPENIEAGLTFFAGNTYLVSQPTRDHGLLTRYLDSLKKEDLRQGTALGDAILSGNEALNMALGQKSVSGPVQTALILLTDGESNMGVSPITAVDVARRNHMRIYTVGMGESTGAYVRGGIFTHLDEETLKMIARETGGEYFRARSFQDFRQIYRNISQSALGVEEKRESLMPWFLAVAALASAAACVWMVRFRQF
jgi:Ca-activated chloride channel family protein